MFISGIVIAFVAGLLIGAFIDNIMDWAKDVFNSLSSYIKKAWVYIRRVPGGIKKMIRYIKDGRMREESEVDDVEWEEVVRMHDDGDIDDDTFNALKAEHDKKVADLDRDR